MTESLCQTVARLKWLEAKATPGKWIATEDRKGEFVIVSNPEHWVFKDPADYPPTQTNDALLISALRNAAPALLDILGEIRAGDAKRFELLLEGYGGWTGSILTDEDKNMLRRYQAMAAKMAEERK